MTSESQRTVQINGTPLAPHLVPGENASHVSTPNDPKQTARSTGESRLPGIFLNVLGVLMRDPSFRGMRLSDLDWLVIPPVLAGQCRLVQMSKPARLAVAPTDRLMPVAVALWARVSDDIDHRLAQMLDKPVLGATEWSTGDNYWLMAVAGDPRVIPTLLGQLEKRDFKGKNTKMRARGPDGQIEIVSLGTYRQRRSQSENAVKH